MHTHLWKWGIELLAIPIDLQQSEIHGGQQQQATTDPEQQ
jgi:hypothetical protein